MRNLQSLSKIEFKRFFKSFDLVLCDVHGVLFNILAPIPGSSNAVGAVQKSGKKFAILSNNTMAIKSEFETNLNALKIFVREEDIITPINVLVNFFKNRKFSKEIFVIGNEFLRNSLTEVGLKIAPRGPLEVNDTIIDYCNETTIDAQNIGAVVVDNTVNVNGIQLQIAIDILYKNPDVLYLVGNRDLKFSAGNGKILIGPGNYQKIIEYISGRTGIPFGKPSIHLNEFILQKYNVSDSKKILMIGDSVATDMAFATQLGCQKLLVLSGITKKESLKEWSHLTEYKPDFYADSLNDLYNMIQKCLN